MHLQTDRSVELHTQGGLHYKTRIPKHGRALAYHYPSCDALISASGHEVYRLSLDQGRFLNPLTLDAATVEGVNCIDINPVHQLLSFGTEPVAGSGTGGVVDFWDPRSRSRVGVLRLPWSQLMGPGQSSSDVHFISSIASRSDGLNLAVGTSTGHTLLYDIRSPRAYAVKDQGYGLPVKSLSWVEGGSKMAGDGILISADKKVIKLWDRNTVCHFSLRLQAGNTLLTRRVLALHQFRLNNACNGYQLRTSCSWLGDAHDSKRRHSNDIVLYSTIRACTEMVQLPGQHHGRNGGPNRT